MSVVVEEKEIASELTFENVATLTAIKGEQFGKEIFSALLRFKELREFLQVFPDVQRKANQRKIGSIKSYILSGLDLNKLRFFSSLTASARGHILYDDSKKKMIVNTIESKLSVNDGQHRYLSICEALDELYKKVKSKRISAEEKELMKSKIDTLENMSIPITIFNNIDPEEERQLFYDLNNLLTKPSRAVNIRLSQTDILSKLAREIAEENQYLIDYGVEFDKSTIHPTNPNTILLTTIYTWCKSYVAKKYNSKEGLSEENFEEAKKEIKDILDQMFKSLPKDINSKGKYILNKGFALRAVFAFILNNLGEGVGKTKIYNAIKKVNWSESDPIWVEFGATAQENGSLIFPGNNRGGFAIVMRVLENQLNSSKKKS